MKIKLTKTNDEWRALSANEQTSVIGDAPFIPTIGKQFYVDSPSGNVKTSIIEEILPDGKFRTRNSIYKVEKL